ncbi:MAG: hypothetical protein O2910_00375 [Proteobacteria bacterium]|nr:hypothetical protein [Pseudomonadota bacterium]
MKIGSFFPNRPLPTFYAMAADDLPLHFDMDDLTDKQRSDHHEQNQLLAMLQVALLSISKPEDYVALFDEFKLSPWREILERQHALTTKAGIDMVPMDHIVHAPIKTFYEDLAGKIPPVDLVTFLMMSRSNQVIHNDQTVIDRMLKLNSKFHFAENAPAFGIPTPDTMIAEQPLKGNAAVEAFFAKHDNKIILKMTGQPGSRNVHAVNNLGEAEDYLSQTRASEPVLVQQRLPIETFQEWTADLLITDTSVELDNVRQILNGNGLWIGNLIHANPPMTDAQRAELLKVGEYVRSFGFGTETGDNMGIDYFISPDGDIIVTEINPRWTAGLFPTQVLRRVNTQGRDAVPYFELVSLDQYDQFLDFAEAHPPGNDGAYSVMPLGFSPVKREIEGEIRVFCWLVVIGDFPAFRKDAKALLGDNALPNGDLVPL